MAENSAPRSFIKMTGYRIAVEQIDNGMPSHGEITLVVEFDGTYKDRSDALIMLLDAWYDAMQESGFDPTKSFESYKNHRHLN